MCVCVCEQSKQKKSSELGSNLKLLAMDFSRKEIMPVLINTSVSHYTSLYSAVFALPNYLSFLAKPTTYFNGSRANLLVKPREAGG